jgi:hypothetical protein
MGAMETLYVHSAEIASAIYLIIAVLLFALGALYAGRFSYHRVHKKERK